MMYMRLQASKETMIQWKERENVSQYVVSLYEQNTLDTLRNYGLYKYFKTQGMRNQGLVLNI